MAWSGSAMFRAYAADCALPAPHLRGIWSYSYQRFRFALYDDTPDPDRTAARPDTFYGTGMWAAGELVSGPLWPAGGPLAEVYVAADPAADPATGYLCLMRPGPVAAGPVTLPGVCGDLLYDPAPGPQQGQGIAFHDFGGPVDVNLGTLTITWPAVPPFVCGFIC